MLTAPKPPPDPNAPADPKATDLTVDQLQAQLVSGAITLRPVLGEVRRRAGQLDHEGHPGHGRRSTSSTPSTRPSRRVTTSTVGEPVIPATETGPLCSQFSVKTVAVSKVFLFFLWLQQNPQVLACTQQRVPYKARVYSKSRGRYVTVTKYKTVKKNCSKKVAKKKVTSRH